MKDEPWRGDANARCQHLEAKLGRQAARIAELEGILRDYRERSADRDRHFACCRALRGIEDPEHAVRELIDAAIEYSAAMRGFYLHLQVSAADRMNRAFVPVIAARKQSEPLA